MREDRQADSPEVGLLQGLINVGNIVEPKASVWVETETQIATDFTPFRKELG